MKISFEDLKNAINEFNTPYTLHTEGDNEADLIKHLEEEGATPFEFCDYIYRHWGPDKLVNTVMVSNKAWEAFVKFRNIRKNENKIKMELEKHRMKYLLNRGCSVRDILTSELETFMVLFKYIIAKASGDTNDLVELYEPGARYELRTMPELRKLLSEFREEYFPKI